MTEGPSLTVELAFGAGDRAHLEELTARLRLARPEDTVMLGLSLLDTLVDLIEANGGYIDVHDDRPLRNREPARVLRLEVYEIQDRAQAA